MIQRGSATRLGFVFDQHVSGPALRILRAKGVDIVHVVEAGLAMGDDAEILRWARAQGRIVVTRNYRDFAPLVQGFATRGESFPGVLFLASSIPQADVGAHARAVETWIERARGTGGNPAAGGFGWLR